MGVAADQQPILVTGASGFAGEHLLRALSSKGIPAVGVYRTHRVQLPGVRMYQADLADRADTDSLVAEVRPRVVVHAAAETDVAYCQERPAEARRAIVVATSCLVDAVRGSSTKAQFVYVSTDLVYDGRRQAWQPAYRETDVPQPLSVYAQLKREAEQCVLGLPAGSVLRSALIYGSPATYKASFLGWMLESLRQNNPLTLFEDERRSPILVEDLSEAILGLIQRNARGLYHAGGGDSLSRYEMGQVVCHEFGFPRSLLRRATLSESSYAAPRPANVSLDSSKLAELLGWKPKPFREGIEWVRDHMSKSTS